MHKRTITTAVLAVIPLLATQAALAEGPISANVGIVSDYAFRGISQTDQRPALQGGFDYAHDSGFYVGVWASNVSWLQDLGAKKSSLELDVYAGYAGEAGPIGYDVGLLQYYYPGSYGGTYKADGNKKPHTLEGYVGLSWEFVSFKYSHSFTNLFGIPKSKNSKYYDLSASYEIMDGLTLDAHHGWSRIKNADNYRDWSVGLTKTLGQFDVGLHYVDTNVSGSLTDDRVILSVSTSF